MNQIFSYIHTVIGYAIALYALLLYWLDYKINQMEANSAEYQAFNQTMIKIHRIIVFGAAGTFLIGGYIGTPFFKVGAGWIIAKFILFMALMGIMGAFGTKALKLRMNAEQSDDTLAIAQKKMNLYKHVQLIIIAVIFYLVYYKPF